MSPFVSRNAPVLSSSKCFDCLLVFVLFCFVGVFGVVVFFVVVVYFSYHYKLSTCRAVIKTPSPCKASVPCIQVMCRSYHFLSLIFPSSVSYYPSSAKLL